MTFVVVYDACVLYPAPVRDLLLRVARTGPVRARWSEGYPNDRHVLAAAIRTGAQLIVTFNLKDFPEDALAQYGIEAKHPDEFIVDQIGLASGAIVKVLIEQAQALTARPLSNPVGVDGTDFVDSVP